MELKIGSKVKWSLSKDVNDLYEIVADKQHPYHGYQYPAKDFIICQIGCGGNDIAVFIEVDRAELIDLSE